MTDTQREPGFGRYRDKDYGNASVAYNSGFWEHDAQGWRYFNSEDEIYPGGYMAWDTAQRYAPFTPVEPVAPAPAQQHFVHEFAGQVLDTARELPIMNPIERRAICLRLAVEHHASPNFKGGDILETAHIFERYITGEEKP